MNKTKVSYEGKKVYVGIDVHKKTYTVTAICEGRIVQQDTMSADREGIVRYLNRRFSGAEINSVYEAGFCGFGLHRALIAGGIKNMVVNPGSMEVAANDRVKTDKRDSKKQAEQLSRGALEGIYIPEESEEMDRVISRTREQIVIQRARVATQIKSKLHYFGKIGGEDRKVNAGYLKELEAMEMGEELSFSLGLLISQWRFLTGQLKEIEGKLRAQAAKDPERERIYRSVPGVGGITSRILANELGDLGKRFENERALYSYTGLTPGEHSSGESIRRGHISRQGSGRLRKYLIEVAWRGIRQDAALAEVFGRIAKTRGKKRAIVAVARKIMGRMRACFKGGVTYQAGLVG